MTRDLSEFERLEVVVSLIMRHPYYPGKESVLGECLEDIEARCQAGQISTEQRYRLRTLILGRPAA
ncbi:MAG: hypothetical protein IRY99_06470 [Isosphaeraceae bacterium]|nr:hypothetical protein [Isosphaeraceae bacterium]